MSLGQDFPFGTREGFSVALRAIFPPCPAAGVFTRPVYLLWDVTPLRVALVPKGSHGEFRRVFLTLARPLVMAEW